MTARINELQRELAAEAPDLQVSLLPTDFAGHARDLALAWRALDVPGQLAVPSLVEAAIGGWCGVEFAHEVEPEIC
jgi:hypothetical protein